MVINHALFAQLWYSQLTYLKEVNHSLSILLTDFVNLLWRVAVFWKTEDWAVVVGHFQQHSSSESFENIISHVTVLSLTQQTPELVLPDAKQSKLWSSKHYSVTGDSDSPLHHQHQPAEKKIWLNGESRNTRDSSVFVTGVGGLKATGCIYLTISQGNISTRSGMNLQFWWSLGVKRTVRDSSVL